MRPQEIGKELQPLLPLIGVDHLMPGEVSDRLEAKKRKIGERLVVLFESVEVITRDPDYRELVDDISYEGSSISCDGPELEIANYYTYQNGRKILQGEGLKGATDRYRELARVANFYIPLDPEVLDSAVGGAVSHKIGPVFEDVTIGFMRQEHYKVDDGKEELLDEETKYQIESVTLLQADNLTGDNTRPGHNLYELAKAFEDFIVIEETSQDVDIIPRFMAQRGMVSELWLTELGYQAEDDDKVAHAREESRRRRKKQSGDNILGGFDIPKLAMTVAIIKEEVQALKEQK